MLLFAGVKVCRKIFSHTCLLTEERQERHGVELKA